MDKFKSCSVISDLKRIQKLLEASAKKQELERVLVGWGLSDQK